MFRHGYTYSGHAAVSAAALANLDIIEDEALLERAKTLEGELTTALAPLAEHPMVGEVRSGTGVLAAIQLDRTVLADDPSIRGPGGARRSPARHHVSGARAGGAADLAATRDRAG
jgi:adenosylmethionine-8-amino-7-oxononanoate aminotransferase